MSGASALSGPGRAPLHFSAVTGCPSSSTETAGFSDEMVARRLCHVAYRRPRPNYDLSDRDCVGSPLPRCGSRRGGQTSQGQDRFGQGGHRLPADSYRHSTGQIVARGICHRRDPCPHVGPPHFCRDRKPANCLFIAERTSLEKSRISYAPPTSIARWKLHQPPVKTGRSRLVEESR